MASQGLVLRPHAASASHHQLSSSCPQVCSCYQLHQWRISVKMCGEIRKISLDSQSDHSSRFQASCCGGQSQKGMIGKNRKEQSKLVTRALPTAVTAAATALAVGGAIFALTKLNKDTPILNSKKECEDCGGSGLCSTCNGEGFVNKNLSAEAAAKARERAQDAATRYTAGLAKKWNYCTTCAGQRGCQSCGGRGWIE